jgi:hypothetical protein
VSEELIIMLLNLTTDTGCLTSHVMFPLFLFKSNLTLIEKTVGVENSARKADPRSETESVVAMVSNSYIRVDWYFHFC